MNSVPIDIDDEARVVTRRAPEWAWSTIDQTLNLDMHSKAFSSDLRKDIECAVTAMEMCVEDETRSRLDEEEVSDELLPKAPIGGLEYPHMQSVVIDARCYGPVPDVTLKVAVMRDAENNIWAEIDGAHRLVHNGRVRLRNKDAPQTDKAPKQKKSRLKPHTVLLMLPDDLRADQCCAADEVTRAWCMAKNVDHAVEKARKALVKEDVIARDRADDYAIVAVYAGHQFDHFRP